MSLPFCTMTTRSARMVLSQQEKSIVLGKVANLLRGLNVRSQSVGLAYQEVRLVIDFDERVIKFMTHHEFVRFHPVLSTINLMPGRMTKAA